MRANEIMGPHETPIDNSRPGAGEGRSLLAPSSASSSVRGVGLENGGIEGARKGLAELSLRIKQ
jgi:hypothetical protein